MNWIDFVIGLCLVNALPHLVLGVWKGRMLSGFGIGDLQNVLYALFNTAISLGLFLFKYGFEGLMENSMYSGGLFVLLMYWLLSKTLSRYFHHAHVENSKS